LNIFSNTVVTLSYKLFSTDGKLIEESAEPITYLHGGHHGIFPKIEAALAQKKVGESCSVLLEPEDAFGEYDADLVRVEPQDRFPPEIKIGMQFEGYAGSEETNGGDDEGQVFTVTDIADGKVVVDGNHPLAGQRLRFDWTSVRRPPRRWRTGTCTARTATTTDSRKIAVAESDAGLVACNAQFDTVWLATIDSQSPASRFNSYNAACASRGDRASGSSAARRSSTGDSGRSVAASGGLAEKRSP